MGQPLYLRGEKRKLVDGREVTIIEKTGDAWKVLNYHGKIEHVYQRQFKPFSAEDAE